MPIGEDRVLRERRALALERIFAEIHVQGSYSAGDELAKAIQLDMIYAPEPPFNAGIPNMAPVLARVLRSVAELTSRRESTAKQVEARLGIDVK